MLGRRMRLQLQPRGVAWCSVDILHGRKVVPGGVAARRVAIPVMQRRAVEIGDEGLQAAIVGRRRDTGVAGALHHDRSLRVRDPGMAEHPEDAGVAVGINLVPGVGVDAPPEPLARLRFVGVVEELGTGHLRGEVSRGNRRDRLRQRLPDRRRVGGLAWRSTGAQQQGQRQGRQPCGKGLQDREAPRCHGERMGRDGSLIPETTPRASG